MDHKEHIKRMAVEAGGVPMRENCLDAEAFPWGVEMEIGTLERFAQAVARECAKLCDDDGTLDAAYCAQAIRARFGLASPPGDG